MYIVREIYSVNMGNSKVNKVFKQLRYNSEYSQINDIRKLGFYGICFNSKNCNWLNRRLFF